MLINAVDKDVLNNFATNMSGRGFLRPYNKRG